MTTTPESRHLDRVAQLGCLICDIYEGAPDGPAEPHHPRCFAGVGKKSPDWLAVPLCRHHHREFHDGAQTFERRYMSEVGLVAETVRRLME